MTSEHQCATLFVPANGKALQVEMWEHISQALVEIGLSVAPSPSEKDGSTQGSGSVGDEELVSYEGMLVSAAAAQRRQ